MPVARGSRVLVTVNVRGIAYGFYTSEPEEILGHTLLPQNGTPNLVIGANNVKPARATKKLATRTRTTFVSTDKIADARAADWSVRPSRFTRGASSATSKLVYVEIGQIKYAWRMPAETYIALGQDKTTLGIKDVTANDFVVMGASFPKPPRVAKFVGASGGANPTPATNYSTFINPTRIDSIGGSASLKVVSAGNYVWGEQDSGGSSGNN